MAKPGKTVPTGAARRTEVRNTPVPRASGTSNTAAPAKQITQQMIAIRAYEISQSPSAGSELENWLRAERELRAR